MKKIINFLIVSIFIMCCIILQNKQVNEVHDKLDVLIKNSNKEKIDSLYQEIMDIGCKYDSIKLKYEYNWEFKNK